MAIQTTQWILELIDKVTAPMQSMQSVANATAGSINKVQEANDNVAKSVNTTTTATMNSGKAAGFASGMFNTLKTAILPLIGITAAMSFFTGSLKDYDAQAKANAQVMATLESTNFAAGKSFEELANQATALQGKTLFGDEMTMQAQALMLTFKEVHGEIYDRSIPAVLDMSTAMNMDLKSASLMVGKALNDPILGLTALRRSGIQFSDSQEAVIKKLVETGNVAEAQKMILTEMESQFGGSAEAAANAGTGALTQISNAWGEVREIIGQGFYALIELIAPIVKEFIGFLGSLFSFILENVEVFKALATGVAVASGAFAVFKVATFLLSGGLGILATTAVTAAQTITAAIASIPIIGWIAAAIAAIIALVTYLWNTSAEFRGFLTGLWDAVKTVFSGIGGFIKEVLEGVWHLIKGVFNPANWFNDDYKFADGFNKITDAAKHYGESIGKAFQEGKVKGLESFEADQKKKENAKSGVRGGDLDLSGNSSVSPVIASPVLSGGGKNGGGSGGGLSGSGIGGTRNITQSIEIKNYFTSARSEDAESIAEKVVSVLNRKLRDSVVAFS